MVVLMLNGPNLNLLGKREPEIYGNLTLDKINESIESNYSNLKFITYQSNHEGALIDRLHQQDFDACVFNPGAYSHTSIALMDAIYSIEKPVVEVHISDISKRESFRQHSYTANACIAMISGKGTQGYSDAVELLIKKLS